MSGQARRSLEATGAGYAEQAKLLSAIVAGACFQADELPSPPEHMRQPPKAQTFAGLLFDLEDLTGLQDL